MDDRARAKEQQRLEECVREQMKNARAVGANAKCDSSKIGDRRATIKTPAVTIVAA